MALFVLRRLAVMLFTALCLTFVVFFLTNLYPNLEKLAKTQGNFRMNDEAVQSYLLNRGYLLPVPVKYGQWLGVLPGIADINDNDNFHQLCFSTSDEIVKISMAANTVEDPNQDPNLYSEIDVSSCTQ